MKLFVRKILVFLLPIAALPCVFEAALRSIPNDYVYKKERMITEAKTIEVLIFGSSHVLADINPTFISSRVFNIGQPTQTPDADYKLLLKYGKNMKNLRGVAIAISDFSLYSRMPDIGAKHRIKNYIIYHHFFFGLKTISPQNYFEMYNGTIIANFERLLSYYKGKQKTITVTETGFNPRYVAADETQLQKSGKYWAEVHKKRSKDRPVDYNEKILRDIIDWCAARNIPIFFFTPPAYKTYIDNLDAAQLRDTFAYMENLVRQNANVTYENFLFEYQDKPEYFSDADHLNTAGARVFSIQIREILRKRGLLD
jgi:hypothetical protein